MAEELGEPPSYGEYHGVGEYSPATVAKRFGDGSWTEAMESLGYSYDYDPWGSKRIPDEDLRADVARVAEELGRPPSIGEYEIAGEYSAEVVAGEPLRAPHHLRGEPAPVPAPPGRKPSPPGRPGPPGAWRGR